MKFLGILLSLLLVGQAFSADEADITESQAIELVQLAVKAIQIDAPGTFQKIIAGESPYKNRENAALYVFVYDAAINMIAHPNKNLVGRNFKGKADVRGKRFRDDIVEMALRKGWIDYHYQKPGEPGIYSKTTYFERVTGSDGKIYIVACGKYQ